MPKALFIGNGINRVFQENSISWDNLLEGLSQNEKLKKNLPGIQNINLNNPLKPFPLAFVCFLTTDRANGHDAWVGTIAGQL